MAEVSLELLEEWEEWDPTSGTSFFIHAFAGSCAGASEHCVMYPVDTIKTHMQAAGSTSVKRSSTFEVFRHLAGSEKGFLRMWRGVSTMLTACIPAHAAYFSIYEVCKENLGANGEHHAPVAVAFSGICATVAHDAIMTPMDVVKQRLQLGFYSGTIDCIKKVLQTEGWRSLYLSYPTTLLMNIPYAAVMTAANESAKRILNPNQEHNIGAFLMSGAFAGGIAAVATNPIDVVKTRLQTQNLLQTFPNCSNVKTKSVAGGNSLPPISKSVNSGTFSRPGPMMNFTGYGFRGTYTSRNEHLSPECICKGETGRNLKYSGFLETLKKIYTEEGMVGFSRGAGSRLLVHAPSVAISWTTYESVKNLLSS